MGAGHLQTLFSGFKATGLIEEFGKNIQLYLFYCILEEQQSLSTLKNNLNVLDEIPGAQWVVVKNLRDGKIKLYDDSVNLRAELISREAKEIELPKMHDPEVFQAVGRSGLALDAFINAKDMAEWATRGRVKTWLQQCYAEYTLLGLTNTTTI